MLVIYKSNLEELLKEASFAVYTFISSEVSFDYHRFKIVLSAWDMEDHPIQLHLDFGTTINGNANEYKKQVEAVKAQLDEIKAKIIEADLEVRDGIFCTVDKPVIGQLQ